MDELSTCDKVFITPDSAAWNPHSEHYSSNEEAMMDSEGNIIVVQEKGNRLVDDSEVGYGQLPSVSVVDTAIDDIIVNAESNNDFSGDTMDEFASLQDLNSDTKEFADRLSTEEFKGRISSIFGCTSSKDRECSLFSSDPDKSNLFELEISGVKGVSKMNANGECTL